MAQQAAEQTLQAFFCSLLILLALAMPALAEPYASAIGPVDVEVTRKEIVLRAAKGDNPCAFAEGQEIFRGARAGAAARGVLTLCRAAPRCALIERTEAVLFVARDGDLVGVLASPSELPCRRVIDGALIATRARAVFNEVSAPAKVSVIPKSTDDCTRAEALRAEAERQRRAGQLGPAAGNLAVALRLCPRGEGRFTEAEIALDRGRLAVAERFAKALVDERPLDPRAHALLARSLKGRSSAREALRAAISDALKRR